MRLFAHPNTPSVPIVAVTTSPRLFGKLPSAAATVHTDLVAHTAPAPRLQRRVMELTKFSQATMLLVGIVFLAWAFLKLVVYQKYGVFQPGWLEIVMGIVIVLAVAMERWGRSYRRCLHGDLVPTRVFISEGKSLLELTLDEGERRAPNSLAGKMVNTSGVTILRRVVVAYEVRGKTFVGQGPLTAGALPALVDGGFKVICDRRWPSRAALLTNYDFEAAPGEPE